jgi:hypothetical protein
LGTNYYWPVARFDESVRKLIAARCAVIADELPAIPYALDRAGITFDDHGRLCNAAVGKGLTCATFILAVLDSLEIRLLSEHEWPEGSDVGWQHAILAKMFDGLRALLPRAQKAFLDVGVRRFQPSEVVGASNNSSFPVSYKRARELATIVDRELKRAA